ncbi:hypothetical protein CAI21_18785 [Alkalilimnicola ehrlichii]|uniref:DUF3592 domain-containing protein n=1 Tax=Alkalilimnicola ehrlichii TaxID=351052 RepID=A0A3E0WKN1_9GAMM|nr:DUF3592 domain-containing protein [Alkalilimnicola ehrlichii]RFA25573.1 hypothetical protein CAI21_18785 [Alkalilimnicola ehrlichii]RFA32701.1 hypothetical protein CAL65_19045 [Alkalilimnicola ehrlichii]
MKILKVVPPLFLFIGLSALVGAGVTGYNSYRFVTTAEPTVGVVLEVRREIGRDSDGNQTVRYYPVVRYQGPNGMATYRSRSGSSSPRFSVGELVPMLYDPANPRNVRMDDFFDLWTATVLFSVFGVIFTLVGGSAVFVFVRRANIVKTLKRNGHRVRARIEGVGRNNSLQVNGRSPWRISCQWHDPSTRRVHVFFSDNLWFDPSQYIEKGQEVDVLVDLRNPKRHYVDTSFLPAAG